MSLPGKQPQAFDRFCDVYAYSLWQEVVICIVALNLMIILSSLGLSISSAMTCISDLFISAEVEVLPYCFEPVTSDSKSIGHGCKVVHGKLDSLSPERAGNTDWYVKIWLSFKQAHISN